MTAWSSLAKNPIEISRTPLASGGTITSSISAGGCSTPSIRGIEKPQTSASIAATRWPRCASAIERLVVTDDLPTPPLPDEIARTRVRASTKGLVRGREAARSATDASTTWSGSRGGSPLRTRATAGSSSSRIARASTSTRSMPSTVRPASVTRRTSSSRIASSGIGSARAITAVAPSMATPWTSPSSPIGRRSSGSSTARRASSTAASTPVLGAMVLALLFCRVRPASGDISTMDAISATDAISTADAINTTEVGRIPA